MENLVTTTGFWKGKSVLLTGHTGFKGSWLTIWLWALGARVHGYSLPPPTTPSLHAAARVCELVTETTADIRDTNSLIRTLEHSQPDVVFHLAAQSIVRASYADPIGTYDVNVMGTVRLLDAIRTYGRPCSVVIVTSDKCYENREIAWGYRESDAMGGSDIYSSSKGCSELLVSSYRKSFFGDRSPESAQVWVGSGRAGNVVGGGDWAPDRIVPDCIRAFASNQAVVLRKPHAVRPWLHVLEPLWGYLTLAEHLVSRGPKYATGWNFGPFECEAVSVLRVARSMASILGIEESRIVVGDCNGPPEAGLLRLDPTLAQIHLGWRARLGFERSIRWTAEWYRDVLRGGDARALCLGQIATYQRDFLDTKQLHLSEDL